MIPRICKECGKSFLPKHGAQSICSDDCRRRRANRSMNEYAKTPKQVEKRRKYMQTYSKTEKYKQRRKAYEQTARFKEINKRNYEKSCEKLVEQDETRMDRTIRLILNKEYTKYSELRYFTKRSINMLVSMGMVKVVNDEISLTDSPMLYATKPFIIKREGHLKSIGTFEKIGAKVREGGLRNVQVNRQGSWDKKYNGFGEFEK